MKKYYQGIGEYSLFEPKRHSIKDETIGHHRLDSTAGYVNQIINQEYENRISSKKSLIEYVKTYNCNYDKIFNTFNTY